MHVTTPKIMSHHSLVWLAFTAMLGGLVARGESSAPRPDLNAVTPIATCNLQTVSVSGRPQYEPGVIGLYSISQPAEDPLANYQRTPLGAWPMPAEADRNNPWLRLLLLNRKRPVVIDLAIFIDGNPFRESREAWIDDAIAGANSQNPQTPRPNGEQHGDANDSGNNNSLPAGTNSADEASVEDASLESPDDENPPRLDSANVAAQRRLAPTMRERLMSYLAVSGAETDRAEIGWLLSEWGAGPGVVVLAQGLSWQRADRSPLEDYLDQDSDGALSAGEIGQVDGLLKRADTNSDDVVEISEIRKAASHLPMTKSASGHALVALLDAKTDWDNLATTFDKVYGDRADASAGDPRSLLSAPADFTLRVDFRIVENADQSAAGASVVSIRDGLSASSDAVITSSDVISLDASGDIIEFSASQAPTGKHQSADASQIAIGAVIDGNPLLRIVDRDQDSRLTLRERHDLRALLTEVDRDADGRVSSDEIPMPIRLAVTLGPHVHELLATPVGSVRAITPGDAAPAPPDWFVSMDKNRDRDLSRGEFLGTTEQFRQFDTDGDGLLSAREALKLNNGQ
jgi:hypothetical protein